AAESVCKMESDSSGARGDDILDLLERLINKSIVIKEETSQDTRYRMLETMRQYANEKLFESNESDRLRDRHLEYFLNLAESAEPHLIRPEQLEWLAKLDADYENLRRALEWALGKESAEFSLRLCAALGAYWFIRTYWLEGSNWLKSALSKTAENSNPLEKAARVKALYRDADLADQLDDIEHMRNSAELSLSLAQEGSDEREIAIARFMVANRLYRDRENEEAHALLEQCYNEFQTLHDLFWQFRSYILLSDIRVTQGKLKPSERIAQAYELARKGGERLMLVDALIHSSEWSYILGRLDEAIRYAREADILIQPIGFSLNPTSFLFAELAWLKGNYEEAKSRYLEMQERFGLIGEKNTRSAIIASLGLLEMEQGNLTQAQSHFEEALSTAREIGSKDFIVRRLAELGIAFYLQGDIGKCRQNLREGVLLIKGLSLIHKRYVLLLMGNFISIQASEILAKILGALAHSERESDLPITPLNKRYYDHAEAKAREKLGDTAFEYAFAEGQKMSLDEALDLALHVVEEL
ncbi:MAG TPA: hypothetical protein VK206_24345, partial [Anaerolineales bacterium]|nr:hypothetical protein [Anaerolineales bacterium]